MSGTSHTASERRSVPRVAFVLVNWNTRELLIDCLRQLGRATRLEAEMVVVDNASGDGSAEAVARELPEIALIHNRDNVGFARAVNQGIRATRAPIVCLLNPDLVIDGGALESCLRVIESDPTIGALGPLLLEGDGRRWEYSDRYPTALGLIRDALICRRSPGRLSKGRRVAADLYEVNWLAGACLLLRRSALDAVGLLDECFFLYREDVDLCLRLQRARYRVVRFHGANLRHLVAQSTRGNPEADSGRADVEGLRSTVLYARKQMGRATATLVAVALRCSLSLRIGKAAILGTLTRRPGQRRKLAWMRQAWLELDRPLPDRSEDSRRAA